MAAFVKRPIQVYLRPERNEALRSLAAQRNVAITELVRQGVDRLLAEVPVEEDPLWDIIGLVKSGPSDLAEKHDDYLVNWISEEHR